MRLYHGLEDTPQRETEEGSKKGELEECTVVHFYTSVFS